MPRIGHYGTETASEDGDMKTLIVGDVIYKMAGSEPWDAFAHATGATFIELQQLEYTIISYLTKLSGIEEPQETMFDVFASKTFGNLFRALEKYEYLEPLVAKMSSVKVRRDFFVHRFLFGRFGGDLTTDDEYEELVRDAAALRKLFAEANTLFHDYMFDKASLVMFGAKRDSETGEIQFIESKFSASGDV